MREAVYLLSSGLVEEIKAQQTLSAAEIGELVVEPGRINAVTLLYEVLNIYLNHEVSMDRRLTGFR